MMKKYILILAAVVSTSVIYAQKNKVVSAFNYNKAFERSQKCNELANGVEAIDLAIEHEMTKNWAKTWYYRGNIYYNILLSENEDCKSITPNYLDKCAESYLRTLSLNFKDINLKKLDLQKEDGSDIQKFIDALASRPKMDDDSYSSDITQRKLPYLAGKYANVGIEKFGKKDYLGAQKDFLKSMNLTEIGGRMDTMLLYNVALASEYGGDNETAKTTYDKLIAMKYNVDDNGVGLYRSMVKIYKKEGNDEKAAEYIKKGREAYPDNNTLLVDELQGFLSSGKHDEALTNLNSAITNDPSNTLYYFARGTVYEGLKDKPKAIEDYSKALELDPNYFDAAFNLGALYFNSGADKTNELNNLKLSETKKYDALKAEAKADFKKAVPYIETAHNAKPGDGNTGQMLINLYTQTGEYEKAALIRAKFE